jgi:hypothetical protein
MMNCLFFLFDYSTLEALSVLTIAPFLPYTARVLENGTIPDPEDKVPRPMTAQWMLIKEAGLCYVLREYLKVSVMLCIRVGIASMALLFLPYSIVSAVIYALYAYISRSGFFPSMTHRLNCCSAEHDLFTGHNEVFFAKGGWDRPDAEYLENDLGKTSWYPWELRGVGYGYLEFAISKTDTFLATHKLR